MNGTGFHGEKWEDDGFLFQVNDLELESLWVRVGGVYNERGLAEDDGVWFTLMRRSNDRKEILAHEEFLLSKSTFDAMVEHVNRRFKEQNHD